MLVPHGSYLLNCGSPDPVTLERSLTTLIHEVKCCERLGAGYYNFHPGSTVGKITPPECIANIARCINKALNETEQITILIENMCGQGHTIGGSFEELKAIIDAVDDKKRIGVCLDTCHVYSAGYDVKTPEGYARTMVEFDKTIGRGYLKAIHLNDSKSGLGSNVDRHENVGLGELGLDGLANFLTDPTLDNIPMILETPDNPNDPGLYQNEMITLYGVAAGTVPTMPTHKTGEEQPYVGLLAVAPAVTGKTGGRKKNPKAAAKGKENEATSADESEASAKVPGGSGAPVSLPANSESEASAVTKAAGRKKTAKQQAAEKAKENEATSTDELEAGAKAHVRADATFSVTMPTESEARAVTKRGRAKKGTVADSVPVIMESTNESETSDKPDVTKRSKAKKLVPVDKTTENDEAPAEKLQKRGGRPKKDPAAGATASANESEASATVVNGTEVILQPETAPVTTKGGRAKKGAGKHHVNDDAIAMESVHEQVTSSKPQGVATGTGKEGKLVQKGTGKHVDDAVAMDTDEPKTRAKSPSATAKVGKPQKEPKNKPGENEDGADVVPEPETAAFGVAKGGRAKKGASKTIIPAEPVAMESTHELETSVAAAKGGKAKKKLETRAKSPSATSVAAAKAGKPQKSPKTKADDSEEASPEKVAKRGGRPKNDTLLSSWVPGQGDAAEGDIGAVIEEMDAETREEVPPAEHIPMDPQNEEDPVRAKYDAVVEELEQQQQQGELGKRGRKPKKGTTVAAAASGDPGMESGVPDGEIDAEEKPVPAKRRRPKKQ